MTEQVLADHRRRIRGMAHWWMKTLASSGYWRWWAARSTAIALAACCTFTLLASIEWGRQTNSVLWKRSICAAVLIHSVGPLVEEAATSLHQAQALDLVLVVLLRELVVVSELLKQRPL